MTIADSEAVAWQRRKQYALPSDPPGKQYQWEDCSRHEATDHWDKQPGYEYRPLYASPQLPAEPVQDRGLVEALLNRANDFMCGALRLSGTPEYRALRAALSAAEPAIRTPDTTGADLKQFENEGEAALRKRNFDFSGERRGNLQAPETTAAALAAIRSGVE